MRSEKNRQTNQASGKQDFSNPFAPITKFHHNEMNKPSILESQNIASQNLYETQEEFKKISFYPQSTNMSGEKEYENMLYP